MKRFIKVKSKKQTDIYKKIILILESKYSLKEKRYREHNLLFIISFLEELLKMYKMKLKRHREENFK